MIWLQDAVKVAIMHGVHLEMEFTGRVAIINTKRFHQLEMTLLYTVD